MNPYRALTTWAGGMEMHFVHIEKLRSAFYRSELSASILIGHRVK